MRPMLILITTCLSFVFSLAQNEKMTIANDSIKTYNERNEALISDEAMAEYYLTQGLALAQNGEFSDAESKFRVALLYDVQNGEILYNLGLTQYHLSNYKDAIRSLDNAAALDPENIDIYNQRGLCKAKLGEYESAESDFITMLTYNPDFPMGNYNYGILLLQMGEFESACEYLNKADTFGYPKAPDIIASYCNN